VEALSQYLTRSSGVAACVNREPRRAPARGEAQSLVQGSAEPRGVLNDASSCDKGRPASFGRGSYY